ncbi:ferredoxin--NADP(+) reductase [Rhodoferax lacus]|uniref:Ferredoxin--NADP reductase n=1 Tax=Rhodoferax lacus TaxID=2184758 RepID=A0A3E1RGQ1_9BURK|nr:NAD(P)/FAD-dependent oxidoreductase [Rhodoferax lacus]RFO98556.1 ferredoxin--NADP(+) reductase [Rhodoferax lacus]
MIETDALIIGAGPVGLFQAFQLGLLEISSHMVDALPYVGGQCVELYADKPIYDIPGVPVCTGRELIESLQKQVAPFKPTLHLGQLVSSVERQSDGRLRVATSTGTTFLAKTLFIAAGVGAFQARMPNVEGLAAHTDKQVHLGLPEGAQWADRDVLVLGDSDTALQAAISLAEQTAPPKSVSLMHRRNVFVAEPDTIASFNALVAAGRIQFVAGQLTGMEEAAGRLTAALYLDAAGAQQALPVDELLVLLGLSPKLGPVAHWGLDMERRQIKVNTETYGTDQPGIFAVGDINTYPGKKKLILCGFHECVLAAFGASAIVFPDKRVLLQYTTTSTRLHALLGVDSSGPVQKP